MSAIPILQTVRKCITNPEDCVDDTPFPNARTSGPVDDVVDLVNRTPGEAGKVVDKIMDSIPSSNARTSAPLDQYLRFVRQLISELPEDKQVDAVNRIIDDLPAMNRAASRGPIGETTSTVEKQVVRPAVQAMGPQYERGYDQTMGIINQQTVVKQVRQEVNTVDGTLGGPKPIPTVQ